MSRCAVIIAVVLLYSSVLSGTIAAQQMDSEPSAQDAVAISIQEEVMPPLPEPIADEDPASPALLNDSNSNAASASENLAEDSSANIEMKLVTRGIYQCTDGNRSVFVDEENRTKYRQCVQIRAPYYEQVNTDNSAELERAPCSGAIVYKGSTYVFNDHEPCPIP